MPPHHPIRHCFSSIDFSAAPIVVVTDFTEGQVYEYDFTLFPTELIGFMSHPTGVYFNSSVRNVGIPYLRVS